MIKKGLLAGILCMLSWGVALAQNTATIRGYVYEKGSGQPVMFANVYLENSTYGGVSDANGLFAIAGIKPGMYRLVATTIGYDTTFIDIDLQGGKILNQNILIEQSGISLSQVDVNAQKIEKTTEVLISTTKAKPRDIKRIPTIGGEADLAQYLTILPGVISTGDQGGALYIRGGAPVQNKILMDGLDIYNAFHSIGLFSVYETEVIQNVDVLTGGFNAEYGGRISAVIDVTTRDGNKQRFAGRIGANPFVSKVILEGPIQKLGDDGSSISYIFTGKHSYLRETSSLLYPYAQQEVVQSDETLPYNFTDFFGKLAINLAGGSQFDFSGFNFRDRVSFNPLADYSWDAVGVGGRFTIVPGQSKSLISGNLDYSDYTIELQEADGKPRTSSIGGFNLGMDFTYFLPNNGEIKYGVDINGFSTTFEFFNSLGIRLDQNQNTTEIGGFFLYRSVTDKLVFEPSLRLQYYASLGDPSFEPRLGMKYNLSDKVRLKFSGGWYSQNLISTRSDRDVVNLFVGFLSGPDERLDQVDGETSNHRLQKAIHAIAGVEYDVTDDFSINVEPYYKRFSQLINLNRNKVFRRDPNYMVETGDAYGIDFLFKYDTERLYLWATYSFGFVTRYDGNQTYPPHYDRRHNVNLLGTYTFGNNNSWEASARWNLGSGFPFTLTQGFFEEINFLEGVSTDYLTQNGNLGILYDDDLNAGRLPYYHRLDVSLKKRITFNKHTILELIASVSNAYNRQNIFYFDRVRYERVDQLPILPTVGFNLAF